MRFETQTTEQTEGILASLQQGRERAKALGRPVLVSVARRVSGELDPLGVFAAAASLNSYRTLWARPEQGLWLLGIGAAATIVAAGEGRLEEVRGAYRTLLDGAVIEEPGTRGAGPVLMGGFRFDPLAPKSEAWHDFPDALLVLPRHLFTWSGAERWLTVNLLVSSQTDIGAETQAVMSTLESLTSRPRLEMEQPSLLRQSGIAADAWTKRVQGALRAIEHGRLTKVVLAQKRELTAGGRFSAEAVLSRLSRSYPECALFAVDSGESCFLGATPETLVRLEGGAVSLDCLAGTTSRGASIEEDRLLGDALRSSTKERLEHATTVAMVAKALGGVCQELRWDAEPRVIQLRNVHHLATSFAGRVNGASDILKLVELLHPTPAVGGVPTEQALETIRRVEGDRGWYAGPVGWLDRHGEGEFSVAIRSALLQGNRATLFAGAGIVNGSEPAQEFRETELKLQPLLAALGRCQA